MSAGSCPCGDRGRRQAKEAMSEPHSFEDIYHQYHPRIRAYLVRLAGAAEADDLCQEVFLRVERGLKQFRGEARLSTWIYRIASNCFHDRLRSPGFRQQARELGVEPDASLSAEGGSVTRAPEAAAEQQLIRGEMNSCIREFIDRLPTAYREVLLLSEEAGFKQREIAEILQISLDNVKIRLHRARASLKQSLEQGCDFYHDERSELACDRKPSTESDL